MSYIIGFILGIIVTVLVLHLLKIHGKIKFGSADDFPRTLQAKPDLKLVIVNKEKKNGKTDSA